MDASQKRAQLEKRAVMGLLGVFTVVLLIALKNMGLLGARPSAPPSLLEGVSAPKTLAAAARQYWEQVNPSPKAEPLASGPALAAVAPHYTAQEVRDPLKSLLPADQPPSQPIETVSASPEPVHTPPPSLKLQGLLWGGSQPQAIIDHRVYRVGEVVEGVKILAIDRRGVTVEHDGSPILYSSTSGPHAAGQGRTQ